MLAKVGALDVAQVSSGPFADDGTFGDPGDGRSVVRPRGDGGVAHVEVVCHDEALGQ